MYADYILRLCYIGSYTIMAKPIKSLELHYPMIQFLIIMLFIIIVKVHLTPKSFLVVNK